MESRQEWIGDLGREVAAVRESSGGRRIIWPKAVRDKAVSLVSGGVSAGEISGVTGITPATIRLWHRRQAGRSANAAGFCELGLRGVGSELVVRLPSGAEISGLGIFHIEQFLKSGLI